ncbi:hypothetical protein [Kribbella turkmenica]|nr:hypothetical protein [Kribbella turkmenica]
MTSDTHELFRAADPDWSSVARHGAYLLAFTLVVAWLSTRAFRTDQRSV